MDYPLWEEARTVWKANQPSSQQLQYELKLAGFVNIQESIEPYPCSIPLHKWQTMIQTKFWSTFSNFTNKELVHASTTIIPNEWKHRIDDQGILHFEDRLVFITANKK